MRERYLDKLLDLLPRELSIEDMEVVTVDCILRALRNEVLLDLCRSPRGKQMVGAAVSVALRSRWSDEDDELPPELLDDDLERLEDDVARQSPRDRETNAG